jgi:hypothetical protein
MRHNEYSPHFTWRFDMTQAPKVSSLETARDKFVEIVKRERLVDAEVTVLARPLTPEEAIGTPGRRDFPIVIGIERMIEATVLGARGHAFTDSASEYIGRIGDVIERPLDTNQNRAIFLATLNAALAHLGMVSGTVHCKDEDPEKCAVDIADHLHSKYGKCIVGLIGLNPAIAEGLVDKFGAENVRITDLGPKTVGDTKFGVEIWDGGTRTEDIVRESGVLLMTGTTLTNGTFDEIKELAERNGTDYIVYGVTTAGVCHLCGIERICPYGAS